MRGEQQYQLCCISEKSAPLFELRMNEALKTIKNPDIRLDANLPFTAYIIYSNSYDVPETLIEGLEILEGIKHYCSECPAFQRSEDGRKRWHFCTEYKKRVHQDSPVCINYYKLRDLRELLVDPQENYTKE